NGRGHKARILIDLNGLESVRQVNTYSWHGRRRQNQRHELFCNASASPSDPKANVLGDDWVSLGSVITDYTFDSPGQICVSFAMPNGGVIVRTRYLLLKVNDPACAYGEIDVVTDAKTALQQFPDPGAAPSEARVTSWKMPWILKGEVPDLAYGNIEQVKGVHGKALKFDGLSTKVVRGRGLATSLAKQFSIEAWVALQEYGLNQTAIINREKGRKTGYFFGIDSQAHLLFMANIGGKWISCVSEELLPVLRWSHVAVTFDPAQGVTLYIDGRTVGHNATRGEFVPAKNANIWIGMSQAKQPTAPKGFTDPDLLSWMVFDGLIDELKVHDQVLSAEQVNAAFASVKPAVAQPLHYRKMPSGPKDGKRFGAFYTRLNYAPEWESKWSVGNLADVVVTFDDSRANFVFWRGTSYIPHWVTRNEIWYNDQFVERYGDGCIGCVEPMSDKMCRFSQVRIIQSNPARIIIHWRYSIVGLKLKQIYVDPYSGEGDWVDEYYTIYPDMVGVRSATLYSANIRGGTSWQESIIVHQPGRMPHDNIEATALSIGNLDGEVADYTWPEAGKSNRLKGLPELSCIQKVNLKSEVSPFMVVPPSRKTGTGVFRGKEKNTIFRHWNHWPVSQGRSSTTFAFDASKPACSSLNGWQWEPYRATDTSKTILMLHGMTDKSVKDLTGLAKSWISPPKARVISGKYRSVGFDKEQKAYVVQATDACNPGALQLRFAASSKSPLVNPAIVVGNWPVGATARVEVAGKKLKNKDIKLGVEHKLEGSNLVVWLRVESDEAIEIRITPASLVLEDNYDEK
ncbi:MAG: LamG domain-containing protein, partial [Deltaproteobacteria bacterium]|nr:LamG domain-containing protein [Deltaproteobacteria bacterium]